MKLAPFLLFALPLLFAWPQNSATIITYTPDNTSVLANPERGFLYRHETISDDLRSIKDQAVHYPPDSLMGYRLEGVTLVKRRYYLRDFLYRPNDTTVSRRCGNPQTPYRPGTPGPGIPAQCPIDEAFLNLMQQDFDDLRGAGLKAIVRFAYDNQPLERPYLDATMAEALAHLKDLKDILIRNRDVIALIEAGFIGKWGEWFYTEHFVENPDTPLVIADTFFVKRFNVLDAILETLPDRSVLVRTPYYKYNMDDSLGRDASRVGHHNDCFLANESDAGTFGAFPSINPSATSISKIRKDQFYLKNDTETGVPMGGEVCYSSGQNRFICPYALADMKRFHWSYLNKGTSDYKHIGPWEIPDTSVYNQYWAGQCVDEIERGLGYRFQLLTGEYPTTIKQNTEFDIRIEVENVGWAAPFNERPVELLLQGIGSNPAVYRATLDGPDRSLRNADPRLWMPQTKTTINGRICPLPGMPTGDYHLYLRLPDPEPGLNLRGEYSIRLANKDAGGHPIWNNGSSALDLNANDLSYTVEMEPLGPGEKGGCSRDSPILEKLAQRGPEPSEVLQGCSRPAVALEYRYPGRWTGFDLKNNYKSPENAPTGTWYNSFPAPYTRAWYDHTAGVPCEGQTIVRFESRTGSTIPPSASELRPFFFSSEHWVAPAVDKYWVLDDGTKCRDLT